MRRTCPSPISTRKHATTWVSIGLRYIFQQAAVKKLHKSIGCQSLLGVQNERLAFDCRSPARLTHSPEASRQRLNPVFEDSPASSSAITEVRHLTTHPNSNCSMPKLILVSAIQALLQYKAASFLQLRSFKPPVLHYHLAQIDLEGFLMQASQACKCHGR